MSDEPKSPGSPEPLPFLLNFAEQLPPPHLRLWVHNAPHEAGTAIQTFSSIVASTGLAFTFPLGADYKEPAEDHAIYAWIGRIAAKWARFEHELDKLIWDLSGMEEGVGACVTGPIMGYSSKLLVLVALLKHLAIDEGLIERTMKLFQAAETHAEERNRCVHDAWFEESQSKTLHQHKSVTRKDVKKKANETLTFGMQPKSEADLEKTISSISGLLERLSNLHTDISSARSASPSKP